MHDRNLQYRVYTEDEVHQDRISAIRFKLSTIIRHVLTLRVNKIIDNIIEYNKNHDVKINDKYIEYLRKFDDDVLSLVESLILLRKVDYSEYDFMMSSIHYRAYDLTKKRCVEIYNMMEQEDIDGMNLIAHPLARMCYYFNVAPIGYEPPDIILLVSFDKDDISHDILNAMSFKNIQLHNIEIDI